MTTKYKMYEYTFSFELSDILEHLRADGFRVRFGKKGIDTVELTFDGELSDAENKGLETTIKKLLPNFKFKQKKIKEIEVGE